MEEILSSPVTETSTSRIEKFVDDLNSMVQRAGTQARERARAADKLVRDHPYQTIGMAVGFGVLIGALARRWWVARV